MQSLIQIVVTVVVCLGFTEGCLHWSAGRFNYEPAIQVAEKMMADEEVLDSQYRLFHEAGCLESHKAERFYPILTENGLDVDAVRKLCTEVERKVSRKK